MASTRIVRSQPIERRVWLDVWLVSAQLNSTREFTVRRCHTQSPRKIEFYKHFVCDLPGIECLRAISLERYSKLGRGTESTAKPEKPMARNTWRSLVRGGGSESSVSGIDMWCLISDEMRALPCCGPGTETGLQIRELRTGIPDA
jgi:hypothetical protein